MSPARATIVLVLGGLALAACRSPRLGGSGDTCGRTDDCEAPLRCLRSVCLSPGETGPATTRTLPAPPRPVGTLPELVPERAAEPAPAAGLPGARTPEPPASGSAGAPPAGLPGQH